MNPNHDEKGRFSAADTAATLSAAKAVRQAYNNYASKQKFAEKMGDLRDALYKKGSGDYKLKATLPKNLAQASHRVYQTYANYGSSAKFAEAMRTLEKVVKVSGR